MPQATKFAVDPGWRILLKDLGVSEDEVLRRAQLPLDLFTRKNAALSAEEYFRIWRAIEAALNDPAFPLRLGQMISTEAFSPPIFAALCSPNLNVAMERLSKYKQLIGPNIIAFVLLLVLSSAVILQNPRDKRSQLLFALCLNLALSVGAGGLLHLSTSESQANFWNKWPYFLGFRHEHVAHPIIAGYRFQRYGTGIEITERGIPG